MDLAALRATVEREIATYTYVVPPGTIGQPMPDEWVTSQLAEMRSALVAPTWKAVAIRDTIEQMRSEVEPELRQCILIADDRKGYELYFDPTAGEYVLAYSGDPPTTFNVRGDAVGCFMAR
jgi:hypothetical protein